MPCKRGKWAIECFTRKESEKSQQWPFFGPKIWCSGSRCYTAPWFIRKQHLSLDKGPRKVMEKPFPPRWEVKADIQGIYKASVNKKPGSTIILNHTEPWQETDLVNQTNYCCSQACLPPTPARSETWAIWRSFSAFWRVGKKRRLAERPGESGSARTSSPRVLGHSYVCTGQLEGQHVLIC